MVNLDAPRHAHAVLVHHAEHDGAAVRHVQAEQALHAARHQPHGADPVDPHLALHTRPHTAMEKWRIVILRFGTARQKLVLE